MHTHRAPKQRLKQWKGLLEKPFRQNLRGWLESFNSNKAGRKACLLLVIPHLLDKASQGSSAALNWCTYPYLYRSSLWLGERGIWQDWQLFKPSCLFAYPHSWQNWLFPGAIFQATRDMVFSLSLPLLMQLCRVNSAGKPVYVFRSRASRASYTNHSGEATLPFACLWPESSLVSLSGCLQVKDTRSSVCAATMEIKCKCNQSEIYTGKSFLKKNMVKNLNADSSVCLLFQGFADSWQKKKI